MFLFSFHPSPLLSPSRPPLPRRRRVSPCETGPAQGVLQSFLPVLLVWGSL